MTLNQKRSLELANRILQNRLAATDLADADWQLLLLAAGLNNIQSHPFVAAKQVLINAAGRKGYFSNAGKIESTTSSPVAAREEVIAASQPAGREMILYTPAPIFAFTPMF